jgi:hypothetical protein
MGIDLTRLANHSMYYNRADKLLEQIEAKTGFRVNIVQEVNGKYQYTPDGSGWVVHIEEGKTLQRQMDENDLIQFDRRNEKLEREYFYINPYVIHYYAEDFYLGRWSAVKYLADNIREEGLPSSENYDSHTSGWQLRNRKKYFEYCETLGTTASVIFCDDKHQEWLDHFVDEKWTFEQFVEWGKKEFVFANFNELKDFNFPPAGHKDHYNVFIYDEFKDLRN